jgi:hypothetical protein
VALWIGLGVIVAALLALGIWVQSRFVPPPQYDVPATEAAAPTTPPA